MAYTEKQFIAIVAPLAVISMKKTNIAASLTIAQAMLESNEGNSGLTIEANALFGIKGKGPAGTTVMKTDEQTQTGKVYSVKAGFRKYNNWQESIDDHAELILKGVSWNRDLYKGVLGKRGADAARAIAAAGYATDVKYAEKLIGLMNQHNLYQYDETNVKTPAATGAEKGGDTILEISKTEWQMLVTALKDLKAKKVQFDDSWIEKAEKGTLTVSQLTWLNTILLSRTTN